MPWLLAATLAALGGASNAMAQSCNITYTWPTWVGGSGFGASIDIRNTGPAITNGWSLVFNFPSGQTLQNGWPVAFSQSGTTVTATSNQAWSNSIPTNGVFNVAFNGTATGANNPPTAFTLNGTACTIGNSTNTPPTVQITAPANNASLPATGTVTIAANASDPGGAVVRVEFRLDGTLLASDTTAPYTATFDAGPVTAGSHTIQATAVDNGNPALTAVQSITVTKGGNTAPTVSVTSPTAGQNFAANTTIPLAATAADPGGAVVRVDFRLDGSTTVVGSDTTSPYNFTVPAGLASGNHSVIATAVDNGTPALSTASASVAFTVGSTNTPPQVTATSPAAGASFAAGAAITFSGTATDPGGSVQRCEFLVDGTIAGTDTTSPYSISLTTIGTGMHTFQVRCFDNLGLSTTTTATNFTVVAGNTPPTVSVTSPTAGQAFAAGATIPLAATAADPGGAVVRVDFRLDGSTTVVGSDTTSPYTFTVPAGLATGNHSVIATAVDNGTPALSTASTSVAFSVGGSSTNALFRVNTAGRITKNGTVFPVRCGSWFGLEGRHEPSTDQDNPSGAPMEQYVGNTFWANNNTGTTRTVAQTMSEISGMGINVIRLPVVPQTLTGTDPQGVPLQPNGRRIFKNHASVMQSSSLAYLEQMIRAADAANIEIMLDIHSCSNYVGWRKGRLDARPPWVDRDRDNYDFKREDSSCAASGNPAGVTRIQAYNTAAWLNDLRTLAGIGTRLGVDNIIGIDIFNEPHDYTWADWSSLTAQAYTAINAVNPNILLFVQGIGTNANGQDGTPDTVVPQAHGAPETNPNWGENLFSAGGAPPNMPRDRLVWSPHTYGPSVFVQKMFMDPAQTQCAGLEGDAAGNLDCNIVINPTLLRAGWEEHFGYLKQLGYAIVVGEFGGNMDWPRGQASIRDQDRWGHITTNVDQQWQDTFVTWMVEKGIEGCYWSINPESGDTAGWYGHAYDPRTNTSGWGEWRPFDQRKTNLLNRLWGR
jgi:aryl-phospho-beta-D-glucosidase BglC (GH1 family)